MEVLAYDTTTELYERILSEGGLMDVLSISLLVVRSSHAPSNVA